MRNFRKEEYIIFLFCLITIGCWSQSNSPKQSQRVGGNCEGCEAVFEYREAVLNGVDTLPMYSETEPKLIIKGTVFKNDNVTPAEDVIVFVYHTNRSGIYPTRGDEQGWDRFQGYIRGWAKTDTNGQYIFHTFRPAAYPNRSEPEHIHMIVKEPKVNEYYVDNIVFADDPLLTRQEKDMLENRGGSGIVHPALEDGILLVQRNIILGMNIPEYE